MKLSALEDSDYELEQQIPGAMQPAQGYLAHDLGSRELVDGRGLKWLIKSNVEQAGSFIEHIDAAKADAQ